MSYPNQKIICCIPEERKKNERYGNLSRKAEIISARLLNDGTASHIVFLHFALHKKDYKFELSKQDLENQLGISAKQYRKAITMLEQAGYLTQSAPHSNIYYFKRIPEKYKDLDIIDIISSPQDQCINAIPEGNNGVTSKEYFQHLQSEKCSPEVDRNISYKPDNTVIEKSDNATFAVDFPETKDSNIPLIFENEEKQRAFQVSDVGYKFRTEYNNLLRSAQWTNTVDGIKVERILRKYLSTHTESAELKKMGDKYGRFVRGWDSERESPVIAYAMSFVEKERMKHDIESIPKGYYL